MNWEEYITDFDEILEGRETSSPYDNPTYVEYTKLNKSRMKRWMKRGVLTDKMKQAVDKINAKQKWILITEPWCGDSAHVAPFLKKIVDSSSYIELEIQVRDGSEIDNYLTNGNRSIPKLIVRDENNKDLFTWGARPAGAAELVKQQKSSNKSTQDKKAELQVCYNKDKGGAFQEEIAALLP